MMNYNKQTTCRTIAPLEKFENYENLKIMKFEIMKISW